MRLVISDDHAGLRAAIRRHFQGASWQRCQVHFTRNLTGQVAATKRSGLAAALRTVFGATTRQDAQAAAGQLADDWRASHPRVAEQLEEEIEDCLSCLAFPAEHQLRIRTTNGMERLSQERKRRTRVVRIFPNREACLRLVSALAMEHSDDWISGRRYLDGGLLTDERRAAVQPALAAD